MDDAVSLPYNLLYPGSTHVDDSTTIVYTKCSYGFVFEHTSKALAESLKESLEEMHSGLIDMFFEPRTKKWIVTQYVESFKEMTQQLGRSV